MMLPPKPIRNNGNQVKALLNSTVKDSIKEKIIVKRDRNPIIQQEEGNKKLQINEKKRKLYKKFLNLGVSGIDPTAKNTKESISRRAMPPKDVRNHYISSIECLPGPKDCVRNSQTKLESFKKHFNTSYESKEDEQNSKSFRIYKNESNFDFEHSDK